MFVSISGMLKYFYQRGGHCPRTSYEEQTGGSRSWTVSAGATEKRREESCPSGGVNCRLAPGNCTS